MESGQNKRSPSAERTGRRVAQIVYYGTVALVSIAATAEVAFQVLSGPRSAEFAWPEGPPRAPEFTSCKTALQGLVQAIDRAKRAASGSDGEDAALLRFRQGLYPEWSQEREAHSLCGSDPKDAAALDAIERLRYAEEHAVRREAGDLAPLRRQTKAYFEGGP